MQIVQSLSNLPASETAIVRLEKDMGATLPEDYRGFLASTNGGQPEPSHVVFETQHGKKDCNIRWFLTLDHRVKLNSIWECLSVYKERMPPGLLPIACDSFDNLFLLDVGARSLGSIYFWDHERESMDDPTWDNISFVAPSFTALTENLQ